MLKTKLGKLTLFFSILVILAVVIIESVILYNNYLFSDKYAKRINNAYNSGDPFTYNELMVKYGTPYSKEITGDPSNASGYVEWYKGFAEGDEKEIVKAYRAQEDIKTMYVEFLDGKAVLAEFHVLNILTDKEIADESK